MTTPVPEILANQPTFHNLGIAPKLLEALDKAKYITPTPIQHKAIPIAVEGKDVIGIAQTGTGKTLAFAIPMLQRLAAVKGRGLVLLPTRELALQVEETFQKIGRSIGLRTVVLIGGASMHRQIQQLRDNPHVIVATPGRLIDHLDQKTLKINDVTVLVMDEADRMLDMGFAPQINRILETVPKERQTMLFSATMPAEITRMVNNYMKIPVRIEVVPPGTTAERVEQEIYFVHKADKTRLLEKLLGEYKGSVLVFSRTKFGARKLTRQIKLMGHTSADIHSDRSLAQRREALEGFKRGKYRILVATDIAARGIDVTGIELVVNYDLPDQSDDYVHRIGRTARNGAKGKAISFAMPDQKPDVKAIERLVRTQIPVKPLPSDLPAPRAAIHLEDEGDSRGGRFDRGSHRGGSRGGHGARGGYARPTPRADMRDDIPRGGERPRTVSTSVPGATAPRDERYAHMAERRMSGASAGGAPSSFRGPRTGGPRGKRKGGPKMDLHEDQFSGSQKRGKAPRKFYGGMGI